MIVFIFLRLQLFEPETMWEEEEKEHTRRKDGWCSWGCYLKSIFALNGIIWGIALLRAIFEQQLTALVPPNITLFHKIHFPGKNVPYLYTIQTTMKNMKEGHFSGDINELQNTVNTFVSDIQSLDGPLFQHEPNTTGLVMTCKLGTLCLANLHHLFDNMNISFPVGLFFVLIFLQLRRDLFTE